MQASAAAGWETAQAGETSGVAKDDRPPVPLAIFEPLDPTKQPMYAKHLVYQGATEFSFEELRAIKIRKRLEEERLAHEKEETAERQSELRRQQEAFREQQQHMKNYMQPAD